MTLQRKLIAEAFGTAWLVIGGCGTAIFAGPAAGVVGISFAFGLTVLTMAYTIGHVSGCHLNPAVTVGLLMAKRISAKEAGPYVAAQVGGAVVGALLLYTIVKLGGLGEIGTFAGNEYGGKFADLGGAFVTEVLLTFFFIFIILGSTSSKAPANFAPIAIGLALTLIHLISIPITNTSVNPARSISQALFAGGEPLKDLWLFIVAPLVGGAGAGVVYPMLIEKEGSDGPGQATS
jgi:aquaporin Z